MQSFQRFVLRVFYAERSERELMEQLDCNLLSRWFVGLGANDSLWDTTVCINKGDRLLEGAIAAKFMRRC